MTDEELWSSVFGQEQAVALLQSTLRKPVHAYLFVGPAGAGRTEAARAFAGGLLATGMTMPGAGRHRQLAVSGRRPDRSWFSPEGRTLLVADARSITMEAFRSPVEGIRKILVVDRFDTAEPEAVACLLKTIEEPPETTVFILLADEVVEDQSTILSRCFRVDLPPLADQDVAAALCLEGVDKQLAETLAAASAGSLERARLLAQDPEVQKRKDAWWSVPDRLDGTGSSVVVIVEELCGLIDQAGHVLTLRHKQEDAKIAEQEEAFGVRGSGRKQLEEVHRREFRRFREDELYIGIATRARRYRDQVVAGDLSAVGATTRITQVCGELVRNPNETLLLQALFLDLSDLK